MYNPIKSISFLEPPTTYEECKKYLHLVDSLGELQTKLQTKKKLTLTESLFLRKIKETFRGMVIILKAENERLNSQIALKDAQIHTVNLEIERCQIKAKIKKTQLDWMQQKNPV